MAYGIIVLVKRDKRVIGNFNNIIIINHHHHKQNPEITLTADKQKPVIKNINIKAAGAFSCLLRDEIKEFMSIYKDNLVCKFTRTNGYQKTGNNHKTASNSGNVAFTNTL